MINVQHLTKEEMLDKVSISAQIFQHNGLYSLDIKWNSQGETRIVEIVITAEINQSKSK